MYIYNVKKINQKNFHLNQTQNVDELTKKHEVDIDPLFCDVNILRIPLFLITVAQWIESKSNYLT